MALWKARKDVDQLPPGTRTVGGTEAFRRVCELEPPFKRHQTVVEDVLRYRNGEAHIGAAGSSDHRTALVGFLTAINELLQVTVEEFWGEHADLVSVTLDENAAEVEKDVNEKLARARLTFSERYDQLDKAQREALRLLIDQETTRHASEEVLIRDCPACSSPCLLSGENRVEVDIDWGRDGQAMGGSHYIEFHAHYLECEACGLELDGEEELEVAEVETVFMNDDIDTNEYLREYYAEDPF